MGWVSEDRTSRPMSSLSFALPCPPRLPVHQRMPWVVSEGERARRQIESRASRGSRRTSLEILPLANLALLPRTFLALLAFSFPLGGLSLFFPLPLSFASVRLARGGFLMGGEVGFLDHLPAPPAEDKFGRIGTGSAPFTSSSGLFGDRLRSAPVDRLRSRLLRSGRGFRRHRGLRRALSRGGRGTTGATADPPDSSVTTAAPRGDGGGDVALRGGGGPPRHFLPRERDLLRRGRVFHDHDTLGVDWPTGRCLPSKPREKATTRGKKNPHEANPIFRIRTRLKCSENFLFLDQILRMGAQSRYSAK